MRKLYLIRFPFWFLVLALIWTDGCATKPIPDPLAGWKSCFSQDPNKLDKAITDDYQKYIQELPPEERRFIGKTEFFEDELGQYAVRLEIALNGTDWAHVLIYGKDKKRIKAIKYASGHYRC